MNATFRLILGDCRSALSALGDDSVQTVITSPPYWGLRDYGVEGQIGLERSPVEFIEQLVTVFREIRRVLKPDGTAWLNLGDCYATGAGKVGDHPGGGEQGSRWKGETRGYRGDRLANGRKDQSAVLRKKTAPRGGHEGKHGYLGQVGPGTQPNRMPIEGLKPKDLVMIPARAALSLQADGWWLRSVVIWNKPNPMPESVTDRPTTSHEYIFLLTKSERYFYDSKASAEPAVGGASGNKTRVLADGADGQRPSDHLGSGVPWSGAPTRNRRTVWTVPTKPFAGAHFATFPEELIEPCVLAGSRPGDVVLDPFNGAGTTGVVALKHGRHYVGCELNPAYVEMTRARLMDVAPMFVREVA